MFCYLIRVCSSDGERVCSHCFSTLALKQSHWNIQIFRFTLFPWSMIPTFGLVEPNFSLILFFSCHDVVVIYVTSMAKQVLSCYLDGCHFVMQRSRLFSIAPFCIPSCHFGSSVVGQSETLVVQNRRVRLSKIVRAGSCCPKSDKHVVQRRVMYLFIHQRVSAIVEI